MSLEIYGLILLGGLFGAICIGFPISFTLITLGMIFGFIGLGTKVFYLMTLTFFDTMLDTVLAAVALFTFMGYILEKAGLMERLFRALLLLSGRLKGSLYMGTIFSATLFAAATGIVGAAVTIIGLMAAPVMKKSNYDSALSAGAICAGGTLGILIPPSIMLVVMGPVMQVSVARLFAAAILPGIMLASMYVIYTMIRVMINPELGPPMSDEELDVPTSFKIREFFLGLLPPSVLVLATLGSIITGLATPTEGAALGCFGALIVTALNGKLTFKLVKEAVFRTAETTSMVMILLAASTFMGVVFSSMGTPLFIAHTLLSWNLPPWVFLVGILIVCFILGWPLEWVPIVVVIVPIFLPIIWEMNINMIWFCMLLAVVLQTCWLSPPVALSAYYIKGIMPEWELLDIYKGMMPFMALQVVGVAMIYFFPQIVLWLPGLLFG
ncbi:MAG: TRAP transporter large permease subunit [Deltaproteobacteria bacterium]|nr:TRAP transporter large permease subunit [Deltaproteobacteria bacterium]MBW2594546.1 TRAP transporter large permease subunit [Deltaproteobacteria bacterium]MBW2649621.1 TRAP transporter large permease subunit [Deltaproteobacteria bacterium]